MSSAAFGALSAAGSRSLRVAGIAKPVAIRNTSLEAAGQVGIRSLREGCAPAARTSGATRHAWNVRDGACTKIGMLGIRIDGTAITVV